MAADRVLVEYAPVTDWVTRELRTPTYRGYLRRTRAGPVSVGDVWHEFVSCGCASPQDVVLRVTAVEGGEELGPDTTVVFVPGE